MLTIGCYTLLDVILKRKNEFKGQISTVNVIEGFNPYTKEGGSNCESDICCRFL